MEQATLGLLGRREIKIKPEGQAFSAFGFTAPPCMKAKDPKREEGGEGKRLSWDIWVLLMQSVIPAVWFLRRVEIV